MTNIQKDVLWFKTRLEQYKKHKISKNESYYTTTYNRHRTQYRFIKLVSIYKESFQSMRNRIR